jgi:NTE family protein
MQGSSPFAPHVVEAVASAAAKYDRVALVLQGGGALGAYQAGVYEALSKAGADPGWLSGVSIGGINAAIIAGNKPEDRLDRLQQFWNTVSGRKLWTDWLPASAEFGQLRTMVSAWSTIAMGQPGFFQPRMPNPWLIPTKDMSSLSYYDTTELRQTLEYVIDFGLLNSGEKRYSVGAVNVRTGNFAFFDSSKMRIGPEHVMAGGALPPALPAIEIDGEFYWDGGIVSNTPLQYLLQQAEDLSSLVFQVDLFSARGRLPGNMPDVAARHKDIMFSSRTRMSTDLFRHFHRLKSRLLDALKRLEDDRLTPADRALIEDYSRPGVVNIVHLIYQSKVSEVDSKDYEFSAATMTDHWKSGFQDTIDTLAHVDWLEPPSTEDGIAVHDIHDKRTYR